MRKIVVLFTLMFCLGAGFSQAQETKITRIMSYNIHAGLGMDGDYDLDRIANLIQLADADLVAIQELDYLTQRSDKQDVLKILAEKTAMHYYYSAAINFDGGTYGVGILSKEEAISTEEMGLPGSEEKRTLLIAEYENCYFMATHLSLTSEDRMESAKIITEKADKLNKAVILAGDFNAEPDSPTMTYLREDWDTLTNEKEYTYPADNASQTLDYILYYENTYPCLLESNQVVDEQTASDHKPIIADIIIIIPIEIAL